MKTKEYNFHYYMGKLLSVRENLSTIQFHFLSENYPKHCPNVAGDIETIQNQIITVDVVIEEIYRAKPSKTVKMRKEDRALLKQFGDHLADEAHRLLTYAWKFYYQAAVAEQKEENRKEGVKE